VNETCALRGYYAVYSDNYLPTFRVNLSVPSSKVKNPIPYFTLLTIPEERKYHIILGASLKSRKAMFSEGHDRSFLLYSMYRWRDFVEVLCVWPTLRVTRKCWLLAIFSRNLAWCARGHEFLYFSVYLIFQYVWL